jgi:hypothetical protein
MGDPLWCQKLNHVCVKSTTIETIILGPQNEAKDHNFVH